MPESGGRSEEIEYPGKPPILKKPIYLGESRQTGSGNGWLRRGMAPPESA